MLYYSNAGTGKANGLYTQYGSCNETNYGQLDTIFNAYKNDYDYFVTFYWGTTDKWHGWGIQNNGNHHRYGDGQHRASPTVLELDDWVTDNDGKKPVPNYACVTAAQVSWQEFSSNPTATWTTSTENQYTTSQTDVASASASIGAVYDGIKGSASFSASTQETVTTVTTTTQTETCSNPCGSDHTLWVQQVITGDPTGGIPMATMMPQCAQVTCVPANGHPPACPAEYCGGDLFDGCQCCTSYDWIASDYNGSRPPLCT